MFHYDLLARARQRELLQEAERARLQRLVSDARRNHPTRPEQKHEHKGQRP